jgi:hypothetical protein
VTTPKRIALTLLASGLAFVGGCIGGIALHDPKVGARIYTVPMPYHVPQYSGGLSLRLAMVHDVIHERFPRHGQNYYRERERLAREKLKTLAPDSDDALALADDIGAGLERLGESEAAVKVLREKLARQEKKGLSGRPLYTSYANLGTFLMHAGLKQWVLGHAGGKERFKEGVDFVKKSVEVNPAAHFGRETWQVVMGEFMLAAMDKLELLNEFDFVGDRLNITINVTGRRTRNTSGETMGWGYYGKHRYGSEMSNPDAITNEDSRASIRKEIAIIGAEAGWSEVPVPWHQAKIPFDEPVLGIIGMWRQGTGANPHFALCLGEIMLRVGQRYIAWCAYERAERLFYKFWPERSSQAFYREHCAKRQREIEATLHSGEANEWKERFKAELDYGERYQNEYQNYEATKIASGASIDDEHFYDEFNNTHEPIATQPGPEEWHVTYAPDLMTRFQYGLAFGTLAAGVVAFVVALLLRRRAVWPLRLQVQQINE